MSFKSTSAQWSYFRRLTGDSLPSGCSKSKASSLIKQALAGKYVKHQPRVSVHGQSIWCPTHRDHGVVKFVVEVDYRPEAGPFATFAEAEQAARGRFPHAELVLEPNSVRQICLD